MARRNGLEIAVVGISCKFPQSENYREFWKNLCNSKELVTSYLDENESENDFMHIHASVFGKEYFDHQFFGYTPEEAALMDPQTRMFHQQVWSGLEDAGIDPYSYDGKIGLFAGAEENLNWRVHAMAKGQNGFVDPFFAGQLSNHEFVNSLIAYKLDLKGPVVYMNTACSTSMVAIHNACRSLLLREADVAIGGGVSLSSVEKKGYQYREGMIGSRDGHCRPFDAQSSGTIGGEGAGVVVLKRLDDALNNKDHIYAVVKASVINNDGSQKVGYTAPSVAGQRDCIRKCIKMAGIKSSEIGYVEAHGTGTALGDPIEIEALSKAYLESDSGSCAIGSVKSNMGHLLAAAGVAGFIKTVLCLKNQKIPATLHFNEPNPNIDFEHSPFYVNNTLKEWKRDTEPLKAAVSSLGIGGTNAHIILEEHVPVEESTTIKTPQVLPFSARTPEALERQQQNMLNFLKENPTVHLGDLSWTLQTGRKAFANRKTLVAESVSEAIEALKGNVFSGSQTVGRQIVFMFSGQGSQYAQMGKDLYESDSFFRSTLDICLEKANTISGVDYKNILYPLSGNTDLLNETQYAQPLLFMFEYTLVKMLEQYGIQPDMMIGHSIGEYTAACLSGVLTLDAALMLVIKRGELMQKLPSGEMLSVGVPMSQVQEFLKEGVDIATVNSPDSCVLSGNSEQIFELMNQFESKGIPCRTLHTSHAFHSQMMTPILDEFAQCISQVEIQEPQIPYISSLTGKEVDWTLLQNPKYWSDHIRKTVLFSEGIQQVLTRENVILVEVGPGTALSTFARQHKENRGETPDVISMTRHPREEISDTVCFLKGVAQLWTQGVPVNWNAFHNGATRHLISIPTYSFELVNYEVSGNIQELLSGKLLGNTGTKNKKVSEWLYEPVWKMSRLQPIVNKSSDQTCCLIIKEKENVGSTMVQEARTMFDHVILVEKGTGFEKLNDHTFTINPLLLSDYEQLFAVLEATKQNPTHFIHMLQEPGYESVLHLAKCLMNQPTPEEVNLVVVTQGVQQIGNEEIDPMRALPLGLSTVIAQEGPTVHVKCVDYSVQDLATNQAMLLLNEVLIPGKGEVLAHRSGQRWERIYDTVLPGTNSKLKNGGTYLITGGLGELGALYAQYLLEHYNASVILVGRTALEEKAARFQELKNKGTVLYYQANSSDLEGMTQIVEEVEQQFGKIDGVIHAAGITSGTSVKGVALITPEDSAIQFEAKVKGTQVLEKIFTSRTLDFCLLVSSLSTILGGKEFGAYAAANTYLDYTAQKRTIQNAIAVNYDALSFSESSVEGLYMNPSEIIDVLEKVLSLEGVSQVLVSVGDLNERLEKWVRQLQKAETTQDVMVNLDRSSISTTFVAPETETEKQISELFETFFGIKEVGMDDDFFELGGDSLKGMTLSQRIMKSMDVEISLHELFNNPTIRQMATVIDNKLWLKNKKETRNEIII